MEKEKFIYKKSWTEFRKTGLLWFTNTILQILGWSLVIDVDTETGDIVNAYPARNKFKGFNEETIKKEGKKLMDYFNDYAEDIKKDFDL